MRARTRIHHFRRLLGRILTTAFAVGIVTLIALWLTFQHKPGWYRPVTLDKAGIQRARGDAVAVADDVSDRMVEGRPFDVVLHDRSVNEWLAALPHCWPDARDALPPQISEPAVHFRGGEVEVGAHCAVDGWQAIISVGVVPAVSEDGTEIEIVLSGTHLGSLPVPRLVLDRLLERVLQAARPGERALPGGEDSLAPVLREVDSVDRLYEGIKIRNRFVWFNGERPFRIDAIAVSDGGLRLRIEPL